MLVTSLFLTMLFGGRARSSPVSIRFVFFLSLFVRLYDVIRSSTWAWIHNERSADTAIEYLAFPEFMFDESIFQFKLSGFPTIYYYQFCWISIFSIFFFLLLLLFCRINKNDCPQFRATPYCELVDRFNKRFCICIIFHFLSSLFYWSPFFGVLFKFFPAITFMRLGNERLFIYCSISSV